LEIAKKLWWSDSITFDIAQIAALSDASVMIFPVEICFSILSRSALLVLSECSAIMALVFVKILVIFVPLFGHD